MADEEARVCRYCLSDDSDAGDGELIAPCGCKGGQRWVHAACLVQWQRAVLVTQPTHPAFYEDDVRQSVCQVCRERFEPPPPDRAVLMASFTGPEIARLLATGCLIATERATSGEMEAEWSGASEEERLSLAHWLRAVYVIVKVQHDLTSGASPPSAPRTRHALGA